MKFQRFDLSDMKEIRLKCQCGRISLVDPKSTIRDQDSRYEDLPNCKTREECGLKETSFENTVADLLNALRFQAQSDNPISVSLEFNE